MRKLVLQEFVSLDGLGSGPGGDLSFIPESLGGDEGIAEHQTRFLTGIDTILLGRVTYEGFAGYWPTPHAEGDPLAPWLNPTPKVVFSTTLERAPWGEFPEAAISRSAIDDIPPLKEQPGKDLICWGSMTLARTLREHGLIDEYQLWVLPRILGAGDPLFPGETPLTMELVDAKTFERGSVLLTYRPRH